jgi:uncharacterized protein with GYD domain
MPTYVALINWTDQGVRNVRETVRRARDQWAALERMGVTLQAIYWTQGVYDLVAAFDAPDDETASAALLAGAQTGNFRTQTLRAFNEQEMLRVLDKLG